MSDRPNVIVVVLDTQRQDYLGCYGNERIQTPNIDAFAARSTRFTEAFPETLATVNVRRALFTARRVYPSRNWRPLPWYLCQSPGWEPIRDDEDTLAENLYAAGYHTGFVADTIPYFSPGFNFFRGFAQWEFIRGQQQDTWKSPFAVPRETLEKYGLSEERLANIRTDYFVNYMGHHLANTCWERDESDTPTARTFQWATDFVTDNQRAQPFYLVVDSFSPHEPWHAPENYYRMYGEPFDRKRPVSIHYGAFADSGLTQQDVQFLIDNYCGLVSLVDAWFGKFIERLDELDLFDNTAIVLVSDHGTNFRDNPRDITGKPEFSMYPGLMNLPLLVSLPGGTGAGQVCERRVYNTDVPATVYELAGVGDHQEIDGRSLLPKITGRGDDSEWPYVTCRLGHSFCYIDDEIWVLTGIDGYPQDFFDRKADPLCRKSIEVAQDDPRFQRAWQRILADAGGDLPDYRGVPQTDNLGFKLKPHVPPVVK